MRKLKLLLLTAALLMGAGTSWAQGSWEAPVVPGVDLSTWNNSEKVYIYNVGADAFVCAGMNWNTCAISTRLTNGDTNASGNHSASVIPNGSTLKMVLDANTGRAIGTNGGDFDCWIDFDHNQDWTFAASENYTNAYTLINTAYTGKKLDVAALYGGKLTIGGGKGLYDWAFIPVSSITDGSYLKFKEKKAMYGVYQALVASGKTSTYATALETANAVYTNASATAADLRAATRALIIAVANGIESRIDATSLFTNADMVGAATSSDWNSSQGISWATFEKYHGTITLTQTKTDVPNGLYDVDFHGFFRQDGSDAAPVLKATGSSELTTNVIEMRTMASTWGCNTNGSNNWRDQSGNIVPDGMKSAGQGLAYEGTVSSINGIPVKGNSLTVSTIVNSSSQWFIWQGYRIYYNGAINLALYKKIVDAVEEAEGLKSSAMEAEKKTALTSAISGADGLSANSDEDDLNTAFDALNTAITNAKASIALYTQIATAISVVEGQQPASAFATIVDGKYNNGTYTAVSEVYNDFYAYQVSVLGSAANTDYTAAIVNPSFERGDTQGWTYEISNDHGAKRNDNATYTMTNCDGDYLFNIWSAGHPITQTLTNLPTGLYKLTAVVANSSDGDPAKVYLIANDVHEGITCDTNGGIGVEGTAKVVVSDGILTIGAVGSNNDAGRSYSAVGVWWYKVDNFRLQYLGDVVSDEDAAALLASVPSGAMNGTVKTALDDAVTAFEGGHTTTNYQALQNAINAANTSIAAYENAKSAIDAAKAIQTNTNVATAAAATTFAEAIAAQETPYNNATMTNDEANAVGTALGVVVSGWHGNPTGAAGVYMESAWDNEPDFGDYYINTWSTEGSNDGSGFVVPFFEYWTDNANSLSGKTLTATQTSLVPDGIYRVSVLARVRQTNNQTKVANSITLEVGEGEPVDMTTGTQVGSTPFYLDTFTAIGQADGDGTLTIKINVYDGSNISWLSFKDVKYTAVELATAEDYAALNSAINTAEGKTLGFESGEYAPYNNVEALEVLAAAKAIDQEAVNTQSSVQAATTALTNATWTANDGAVNAIYDGNFAIQNEHTTSPTTLAGWAEVEGLRQLIKNTETDPGLTYASANAAIFTWGGTTITYGEQQGYTLPLDASVYKLTFKACGWRDGDMANWMSAALYKNSIEVETVSKTPTINGRINQAEGDPFVTLTYYLTVPEAGNYVLKLYTNKHTTWTDFNMIKAVAEDFTIAETETYTPVEKYANVTFNRTLVAGWNGLVLPFDMTVANVKTTFGATEVKDFTGITYNAENGVTLNFGDAETITAGKPFMVKVTSGNTSYTINNVILSDNGLQNVTKEAEGNPNISYVMKGTYAASTDLTDVDFALINGTTFYYHSAASAKASSAKAFRAYFQNISTDPEGARVSFDFGEGGTTAIQQVNNVNVQQGDVYDLQGRKVQNISRKGIYIQNGHKVVK